MVIAAWVGDAFAPQWVDKHPLWLIALNARNRNLILVTNNLDAWSYYGVATLRLLASDPLFFVLGFFYGDRAVAWMETAVDDLRRDRALVGGSLPASVLSARVHRPEQLHLPLRRVGGHAAGHLRRSERQRDHRPRCFLIRPAR